MGLLSGLTPSFAIAAEGDGADVAGGDAVGLDDIGDRGAELVDGVGERHAVDLGGVDEALHVLGQAEDAGAVGLCVAADAFEDGGAVVDDVAHDVDLGLIPGDKFAVVPDVGGCLDGHAVLRFAA